MPRTATRAQLYVQAREEGMSYREIAGKYGVTYQRVAQVCAKGGSRFRPYKETEVVFPNLRKWLNENKVSRAEMLRRMGRQPHSAGIKTMTGWLSGEHDPSKLQIDRMLAITGLTYEQFFAREDGNG